MDIADSEAEAAKMISLPTDARREGLACRRIPRGTCSKQQKPVEAQGQVVQKTFASTDEAAKALVDAAKSDNRDAMLAIFGPGSKDLIYSGDAAEDKAAFAGYPVSSTLRELQRFSGVIMIRTSSLNGIVLLMAIGFVHVLPLAAQDTPPSASAKPASASAADAK